MVVHKLSIKILILSLIILLQGSVASVFAQEPVEEGNEPLPAVAPSSGQLEITLEQLGYGPETLNRNNTNLIYRLDLPGNFVITPGNNYFDLVSTHLLKTLDGTATLQTNVNDRAVAATELTTENSLTSTIRVDLAESDLKTGRNIIELDLDTGGSCEEPAADIRVSVDPASTLSFGYQQRPYQADLSLYPFPFAERSVLETPVTIVLPDQPTAKDLSAAATIAGGLGRASRGEIDLSTVAATDLDAEQRNNSHLIVIGQPENNSVLADLELPLPISRTNLETGHGVLQEIVSPWNEFRLVLTVGGLSDEAVAKASQTLNRQANFLGMRGPVAVVIDLLPLDEAEISDTGSMTLASQGYDDQVVYGGESQSFDFDFDLPPGWRLEEPPFFTLKFAHADILDPYQSIIDIKLNGLPIGSALLDKSNTNEGELTVTLPMHKLRTGRNLLTVGVDMSLPGTDACAARNDDRAWTVVNSESEVFLPYDAVNLPPDLRLLPHPFSSQFGFDETIIVLPDDAPAASLDHAVQLAAYLGRASRPQHVAAHITYASEVDKAMRENNNLILLGLPTEHDLIAEINDNLPQPFMPDSNLLKPLAVDSVSFMPDPERVAGLLQVINSPWNSNYSLLAITGTSQEGIGLALESLLSETRGLKGNVAVIEPTPIPSDETDPIKIHSTDTRPPEEVSDDEASLEDKFTENDLVLLSKRWWK